MAERVLQEFYCRKSGGGCGGYFRVKLNIGINGIVKVICPKCQHEHQRNIQDGLIKEDNRYSATPKQEIVPTMAAYSEDPMTDAMKDIIGKNGDADGVEISRSKDEDLVAKAILRESMIGRWGKKLLRK